MTRQRFIVLLIAALVAITGALYFSSRRNLISDGQGSLLLPSLANELNTVTLLSVRKGGATPAVTIHKQGEQWSVAEKGDYPADVAKVRKLLLALSEARIREQKTSNPASFPIIGVEDPTLPGASGAQLEFAAPDGKHALIIGKPVGAGNFVRRAGENNSYIVEPGITFEAEPRYWIDSRLVDLPAAKIQSIELNFASDPGYPLHRVPPAPGGAAAPPPSPSSNSFTIDGVPKGRKAADPQALAPSPTAFSGLGADDVAQAGDIDFSMPSIATLTMADGTAVTFTGAAIGNKRWIKVTATQDAALNAKTAGRAFEIATYRYDAIFRPLEQLLAPKEAATDTQKAAHGAEVPAASTHVTPAKKLPPAPTP
jgi:hypothetical protein